MFVTLSGCWHDSNVKVTGFGVLMSLYFELPAVYYERSTDAFRECLHSTPEQQERCGVQRYTMIRPGEKVEMMTC